MAVVMDFRARALQSREAVDLLSSKWRIPIIHLLRDGPVRPGELQRGISDISPKVLTGTLRAMERDGLICRDVQGVVPARVEYSLTGMGRSLIEPLENLCHWAKAHVDERDAARKRFDTAANSGKGTGKAAG
jgi:DNA-binding HxlR family transcriptional regulator